MIPLYHRLRDATPIEDELADAALGWFEDRLTQADMLLELREVLPGTPDERLLSVIAAVCRILHQP